MISNNTDLIITILTEEAREYGAAADWYDNCRAQGLSELCRYAQKTLLDALDYIDSEHVGADELDELLENIINDYQKRYKWLQSDGFEHLADLAMSGYMALVDVAHIIEMNK